METAVQQNQWTIVSNQLGNEQWWVSNKRTGGDVRYNSDDCDYFLKYSILYVYTVPAPKRFNSKE